MRLLRNMASVLFNALWRHLKSHSQYIQVSHP